MRGYIDVPYECLRQYWNAVQKKMDVCKILPDGRFHHGNEGIYYAGLVCSDDMGGDNTGFGAEYCENCILKGELSS